MNSLHHWLNLIIDACLTIVAITVTIAAVTIAWRTLRRRS